MLHSKPLINPPTLIETTKDIRYLIVDSPSQSTLPIYLQEFERWNVTDVVRCCEPTYPKEVLEEKGIQVHDWTYADGDQPPGHLVNNWLKLIRQTRMEAMEKRKTGSQKWIPCIATHCVAGLGRAPVLVAIALIEDGMSPLDSVELIRERRRGAINSKQLRYLETYKREQQAGGYLPELRQLYQQQQRHETEMKEDDATIVSSGRTPYRRVRFASTSTANTLVESVISNRIKAEHYKLLYGSPFILSGLQTTNPSAEPDPHMHPVASMLVHTSLHFFFPPPIVHFFTQLLYTRKIPS